MQGDNMTSRYATISQRVSYCKETVKNLTKLISDYQNLPLQKETKIYWGEQLPNVNNNSNFFQKPLLTGIRK